MIPRCPRSSLRNRARPHVVLQQTLAMTTIVRGHGRPAGNPAFNRSARLGCARDRHDLHWLRDVPEKGEARSAEQTRVWQPVAGALGRAADAESAGGTV